MDANVRGTLPDCRIGRDCIVDCRQVDASQSAKLIQMGLSTYGLMTRVLLSRECDAFRMDGDVARMQGGRVQ